MENEAIKKWNAIMLESKQADLKSKLIVLNAVIALSDRPDIKTAGDVIGIINQYKKVLDIQVEVYE